MAGLVARVGRLPVLDLPALRIDGRRHEHERRLDPVLPGHDRSGTGDGGPGRRLGGLNLPARGEERKDRQGIVLARPVAGEVGGYSSPVVADESLAGGLDQNHDRRLEGRQDVGAVQRGRRRRRVSEGHRRRHDLVRHVERDVRALLGVRDLGERSALRVGAVVVLAGGADDDLVRVRHRPGRDRATAPREGHAVGLVERRADVDAGDVEDARGGLSRARSEIDDDGVAVGHQRAVLAVPQLAIVASVDLADGLNVDVRRPVRDGRHRQGARALVVRHADDDRGPGRDLRGRRERQRVDAGSRPCPDANRRSDRHGSPLCRGEPTTTEPGRLDQAGMASFVF